MTREELIKREVARRVFQIFEDVLNETLKDVRERLEDIERPQPSEETK